MTRIKDIIHSLEAWAPVSYAENYDNVGLISGDSSKEVTGVLVSLDCTEEVVDEAIKKNCNIIVSHHPIIFKGLKRLTGANYVERTVIKAIKNDVALYAIHTNLDNIQTGVNKKIADIIGLENTRILSPKSNRLEKITFFVPTVHANKVRSAVFEAGGGEIGDYANCSFNLIGEGTFKPGDSANPFIGERGELQIESETRIEVMYPDFARRRILHALKQAHPYEEVAYSIHQLENTNETVGSGMLGSTSEPIEPMEFLQHLKNAMELKVLKHTSITDSTVRTIAVCGGSGSFLLRDAKAAGADLFITSDFKYHEFFDAEDQIIIVDIGHYESERFTIDLIADFISKKFSTFATHLTGVVTNPIHYF
ncbi:MAG TPA: Nif3-like dinuclear metal center hexameric protein [Cryomorphaceae bacterium]|nr:Nif3-like dinuclear metal center hexameric protein [Cryomorphaceae bacterium]